MSARRLLSRGRGCTTPFPRWFLGLARSSASSRALSPRPLSWPFLSASLRPVACSRSHNLQVTWSQCPLRTTPCLGSGSEQPPGSSPASRGPRWCAGRLRGRRRRRAEVGPSLCLTPLVPGTPPATPDTLPGELPHSLAAVTATVPTF